MQLFFKWLLRPLAVLVIVGIIGLVLYPILARGPDRTRLYCQAQLKQIGLGLFQYSQDYDEKLPPVGIKDANINQQNPLGWADTLFPYLKSQQVFWCTTQLKNGVRDGKTRTPAARDYTDYFFNRRLGGLHHQKLEAAALTIMLGDGNDGSDAANARYSLEELPAKWRTDKSSPGYRHGEGANYAFADGHVKWLQPKAVTNEPVKKGRFTFSVR